ncbi:MAG: hypothetical protein HY245_05060 [Rhizobiales bacterium]|nr:hypothetical protein [Hyphomicrobiales bacterium]MBI3672783.1 hypothetical protein [Hyphomicrobiales bacterium]
MLKLAAIGLWAATVTAGAAYLSAGYLAGANAGKTAKPASLGLEQITSDMTSVPMIRGGAILGYVIIQVNFEADKALLEEMKVDAKPYLVDAAFRAVYSNEETDFTRVKGDDLDRLTRRIAELANGNLGAEVVKQVLIQQLNYVRKEDIRTHWIKEK